MHIISGLSVYSAEHCESLFLALDSHGKKAKISSSLRRCRTKLHDWIRNHLIVKSSLIRMLNFISFVASAGIEALGT